LDASDEKSAGAPEESKLYFQPISGGCGDELQQIYRIASDSSRRSINASRPEGAALSTTETFQNLDKTSPELDPKSPQFDIYKWVRVLMNSIDGSNIRIRHAGFTFKNLNISGVGTALQLQKNVGSTLLAPLRILEYFKSGSGRKSTILRGFDGVTKSGELLVVLGRPGSGCSTFLKSIAGQLHGLHIDQNSVIHYNGIGQKTMMKEFKGEVVYNQEVDKR
jgi:ATP-binding cassette, subfamily G (WHITE), member 2, PDR